MKTPDDGYWTTRYIGSLIYEGEPGQETLEGVVTDNGFIQWNGSAASSRMQYFLRDHLGSVRVIAEDRHTVISRTDYLPFGVRMSGDGLTGGNATSRSSFFGFSGKENEMWDGYDTADGDITPHWLKGERYQHFGARAYDPVSCIFMQVDPMAEKYYGMTPYGYCLNNPINLIDPTGAVSWELIAKGTVSFALGSVSTAILVASTAASSGAASPLTLPLSVEAFGELGLGVTYVILGLCADNDEKSDSLPSSPSAAFVTGAGVASGMEMNDAAELGEAVSSIIGLFSDSSKPSSVLFIINNFTGDTRNETDKQEVIDDSQSEEQTVNINVVNWYDPNNFLYTSNNY